MNIILLSGGSGKRLWPLSNDVRSKQFIKIFKTRDGHESMVQRVYRQITSVDRNAEITIATSKTQVSSIHNQLGNKVDISVEPCRRDTFPAIALATAYLADVKGIIPCETVVVCPVDPFVENDYFNALNKLSGQADKGEANLVLMGIEPTYPSEKYGYIIPSNKNEITMVSAFKEKPDAQAAERYIKKGALWNSGVFAYKISYILNKTKELFGYCDYNTLYKNYSALPSISFDYAIAEKEPSIQVLRFNGMWKDIGTWNTLIEAMDEATIGNGRMNENCSNVHIVNELDIPILAMGLHNIIISASPEGILVSDKEQSSYIKPFVNDIHQQIRFAEKSWGSFKVIDIEDESLAIKVTLNPGHSMNYHSHERRNEVWLVINGQGRAIVDGVEQSVKTGDIISIHAGCRHTIIADTELKLLEVQLGNDISVSDKHKYNFEEEHYQLWLQSPVIDELTKAELRGLKGNKAEITDRFCKNLQFGTGGMRGIMGAGTNRMNLYTVRRTTQGLSNYIKKNGKKSYESQFCQGVVIGFDSRRMSAEFAREAALCLAGNGIKAYVFESLRPVSVLSYAVRYLGCIAGIMVTASHNLPEYNGYKVYWEDGAQITAPRDKEIIEEINKITDMGQAYTINLDQARQQGLYQMIGKEIDDCYMDEIKKLVLNPNVIQKEGKNLKIVYTPLHGAGNLPVQRILRDLGFEKVYIVPEQEMPNGDFPTVKYPNPEEKNAFVLALQLAKKVDADLVVATDPDADRLGVYGKNKDTGEYEAFTGNMVGMIILEYLLSQKKTKKELPENGAVLTTIVSGKMSGEIVKHYGVERFETLTGFKYIGEQIHTFEQTHKYKFIFGYEESCGCLVGTHARDKDAVSAVMTLCEAAAYYQSQGITLCQQMEQLYKKYGYFHEGLFTVTMKDLEQEKKVRELIDGIQKKPPAKIGRYHVDKFRDYNKHTILDCRTGKVSPSRLPKSNVLYFELEDNAWCCIRPSGTEPKIKCYMGVKGKNQEDAQEKLEELMAAVRILIAF